MLSCCSSLLRHGTYRLSISIDELYFNFSKRDDGEFFEPQDTIPDVGSHFVVTFSRIMRVASAIAYREGSVAFKLSSSSGYNAYNNSSNLDYFSKGLVGARVTHHVWLDVKQAWQTSHSPPLSITTPPAT